MKRRPSFPPGFLPSSKPLPERNTAAVRGTRRIRSNETFAGGDGPADSPAGGHENVSPPETILQGELEKKSSWQCDIAGEQRTAILMWPADEFSYEDIAGCSAARSRPRNR